MVGWDLSTHTPNSSGNRAHRAINTGTPTVPTEAGAFLGQFSTTRRIWEHPGTSALSSSAPHLREGRQIIQPHLEWVAGHALARTSVLSSKSGAPKSAAFRALTWLQNIGKKSRGEVCPGPCLLVVAQASASRGQLSPPFPPVQGKGCELAPPTRICAAGKSRRLGLALHAHTLAERASWLLTATTFLWPVLEDSWVSTSTRCGGSP